MHSVYSAFIRCMQPPMKKYYIGSILRIGCTAFTTIILNRGCKKICPQRKAARNTADLPQSSGAHQQCLYKKSAAFNAAASNTDIADAAAFHTTAAFELLLTEFPAILLFTLAHRYLGFSSMLFAAGAGIVFRIAYLKLKRVFHPAISIALVAAVHGLWNIGVYYYLWGNTITRVISRLYGLSANAISFTFSELYTAISFA